jgi:putative transposase
MDAILARKADELAKELATQATTLEELNGVMRSLMKTALERMLNTELDVHLEDGVGETIPVGDQDAPANNTDQPQSRNRRNGYSPKTIQGDMGKLPIDVPRDRDGTFEPQLIGKYQRRLEGFDEKILALYAKGLTTRDIQDIVKELYGVDVSPTLISNITADLDAEVKAWQTRQLEATYPIVFLDGSWKKGAARPVARGDRRCQVLVIVSD